MGLRIANVFECMYYVHCVAAFHHKLKTYAHAVCIFLVEMGYLLQSVKGIYYVTYYLCNTFKAFLHSTKVFHKLSCRNLMCDTILLFQFYGIIRGEILLLGFDSSMRTIFKGTKQNIMRR